MEMENRLTEDATAVTGLSKQEGSITGEGKHYSTYFRMYDADFGRWWSRDPVTHPFQSPYTAFDNNPISIIDPLGADGLDDKSGHHLSAPLPSENKGGADVGGGENGAIQEQGQSLENRGFLPYDVVLGNHIDPNMSQLSKDEMNAIQNNYDDSVDKLFEARPELVQKGYIEIIAVTQKFMENIYKKKGNYRGSTRVFFDNGMSTYKTAIIYIDVDVLIRGTTQMPNSLVRDVYEEDGNWWQKIWNNNTITLLDVIGHEYGHAVSRMNEPYIYMFPNLDKWDYVQREGFAIQYMNKIRKYYGKLPGMVPKQ